MYNTEESPNEMHSNNTAIPYISLFSGYEGIGIGIKRIFGENLRTIGYCEREAYACKNLVDKIEKGRLDAAPIFTDVHTFPWEQYAPFMAGGILSFGFPCQPMSCAGKRKVAEDERWMFDICADGIAILKPGILFAENVEGLLSAKMQNGKPVIAHIFERLEKLHYAVEAGLFSAAEVCAPHQRKRVFILAQSSSTRPRNKNRQAGSETGKKILRQENGQKCSIRIDSAGADTKCRDQWPARPGEPQYEWEEPRTVADNTSQRLQNRKSKKTETSTTKPKRQNGRKVKSGLGGKLNGIAPGLDANRNRIDRLRLLGNGVVPQTAEKAFRTLYDRIINPNIKKQQPVQMELF